MLGIRDGPCNTAGWRFGDQTEKIYSTNSGLPSGCLAADRAVDRAFTTKIRVSLHTWSRVSSTDTRCYLVILRSRRISWQELLKSNLLKSTFSISTYFCTFFVLSSCQSFVYFLSLVAKPPASVIAWTISYFKHKGKTLKERYSFYVSSQGYCMGHLRFQA